MKTTLCQGLFKFLIRDLDHIRGLFLLLYLAVLSRIMDECASLSKTCRVDPMLYTS